MTGIRRVPFVSEQVAMATGQTTWPAGSLIAHATVTATDVQAGRLSTGVNDVILGVYRGPSPANASSFAGPDAFPEVVRWGTGIPILVEAGATIDLDDPLTPSSLTPGAVRLAEPGEPAVARALTEILSGGPANIVMADLYPASRAEMGSSVTPSANVVAEEIGSGVLQMVRLTLTNVVLPAITGGVAQAVGAQLCTFPSANYNIVGAHLLVSITQTDGFINADTPVMGLGTVVATGAVSVLSGTPAFEDVMVGSAIANCTGTFNRRQVAQDVPVLRTDTDNLFLNLADTWAAGGDAGALANGTVVVRYDHFSSL